MLYKVSGFIKIKIFVNTVARENTNYIFYLHVGNFKQNPLLCFFFRISKIRSKVGIPSV